MLFIRCRDISFSCVYTLKGDIQTTKRLPRPRSIKRLTYSPVKPRIMNGKKIWAVLKKTVSNKSEETKRQEIESLSRDADPELCVRLITRPSVQNYAGIKTKLVKSTPEWMEEFLKLEGLEALFLSLERLSDKNINSIVDAFIQVEAVCCIKAVMNSKAGLEHVIENPKFTRTLATGMTTIIQCNKCVCISILYF